MATKNVYNTKWWNIYLHLHAVSKHNVFFYLILDYGNK